jgi:hypothetical protein
VDEKALDAAATSLAQSALPGGLEVQTLPATTQPQGKKQ